MTLRELKYMLSAINQREINNAKFEASLHGHKLEIPTENVPEVKVDEIQERAIEVSRADAMARVRARYGQQ